MLDWLFSPSCPCDSAAKAWIEERLEWLAEEFDDHAFNGRRIVLPTPEFFPDPYDGSKRSVYDLVDRVCEYMDVERNLIQLKFSNTASKVWLEDDLGRGVPVGAAGTYQEGDSGFIITLDKSEFHDPIGLVGTIAHELSHVRLLGESRIMREVFDNEILTDLTTVHFGLGIFLSNTPRAWESQFTKWPDTNLLKPEYLSPPMWGWALAHLAWFRGEEQPAWAQYLNSSARSNLKQGIRYLFATADSAYKPLRLRRPQR